MKHRRIEIWDLRTTNLDPVIISSVSDPETRLSTFLFSEVRTLFTTIILRALLGSKSLRSLDLSILWAVSSPNFSKTGFKHTVSWRQQWSRDSVPTPEHRWTFHHPHPDPQGHCAAHAFLSEPQSIQHFYHQVRKTPSWTRCYYLLGICYEFTICSSFV